MLNIYDKKMNEIKKKFNNTHKNLYKLKNNHLNNLK